jgi:hypothetical protein
MSCGLSAAGWMAEESGFGSQQDEEIFIFTVSRLTLGQN